MRKSQTDELNFLLISAHDYRTPRRASMHFIADELAKRGNVRFFSLRYSALSRFKHDLRVSVDEKANRKEFHGGVECYLWKTIVHPFNARRSLLKPLEHLLFWWYRIKPSPVLVEWMKQADVIVFESGLAIIYFELACALNPDAEKIYRASDDLATINVAHAVHQSFNRAAARISSICMLSPQMAKNMPKTNNQYYVQNGIDHSIDGLADPSPYGVGLHAISVGSMLFDPTFFEIASHAFPDITFHIIGSGLPAQPGYAANVRVYGDMKYTDTLRYIKHASFGIAPYISKNVPSYLADSSLKLLQYDFFGLPAVCPCSVVGSYSSRFGYDPGDMASIQAAIRAAVSATHERTRRCLSWEEVTDRLLEPERFSDTKI